MSVIGKIGSGIGTLAARGVGLGAVGMVAYDAHVLGKLDADTFSQSREADRLVAGAHNRMLLDTPSTVAGKIKDKIFNFQLGTNIFMPFEAVIGYFKGVANSCVDNCITLGAGLLALLGGKKLSRLSALGLFVYGGYKFFTDGLGFGRPNRINPPFK